MLIAPGTAVLLAGCSDPGPEDKLPEVQAILDAAEDRYGSEPWWPERHYDPDELLALAWNFSLTCVVADEALADDRPGTSEGWVHDNVFHNTADDSPQQIELAAWQLNQVLTTFCPETADELLRRLHARSLSDYIQDAIDSDP